MTYVHIDTVAIRNAGQDFDEVAQILLKGINAAQLAQEVVEANYVTEIKAQEVKSALNDWLDFAPGFRVEVSNLAADLMQVAATYEQIDQA
jgi:hypothetical protein